jgi:hypothetical protein
MRKVPNFDFTCLITTGTTDTSENMRWTSAQKLSMSTNQPSPQANPQHIEVTCGD